MTLIKFKNGSGLDNFPSIERAFGFPSLFSDTFERLWSDEENINWMPSANIRERAEDFKIDLAVPGMEKKDFTVDVENGVLTIRGERKEENVEENEKVTRREFHYGSFKRSFSLPESADVDKITAAYKDGLLSLTVAKREEMKAKARKNIAIE
jgi:HSP20 family protein